METLGIWLSPLLLLPGSAMLILSTATRYSRIHDEVHYLMRHGGSHREVRACRLLTRARVLRRALTALYGSVTCFALGALVGGVTSAWARVSVPALWTLTCLGILGILIAAGLLFRESRASFDVIREHVEELRVKGDAESLD